MALVGVSIRGPSRGDAHEMDHGLAGTPIRLFIIERPAEDGLPEVIRSVDHDDDVVLPDYVSSDEEDGEVEVGIAIPLLSSDEEEDMEVDDRLSVASEEEEDEDDIDIENWTSEDSGYESLLEDEEDSEDEDFRPRSPLVQQLPPEDFWQGWREDYPPLLAGPPVVGPPIAGPPVAGPPVAGPLEPDECAPSTSGLSSSTKRSREDTHLEEVTAKRPRWNSEEVPDDSAPSTSTSYSSGRDESYLDSEPSTSSGLRNRGFWDSPFGIPWRADDSDFD
ncbi:proline-%2C glutamic acid- and leucine-rich protein 1-like [Scomber scombrus]|uniref:Proline-, glutamic acid- and leucine-rich protein 1-like n=1 Tax=Scomber scombrus TaxID=13677 RepID=A0AAV1N6D0_SCOSC